MALIKISLWSKLIWFQKGLFSSGIKNNNLQKHQKNGRHRAHHIHRDQPHPGDHRFFPLPRQKDHPPCNYSNQSACHRQHDWKKSLPCFFCNLRRRKDIPMIQYFNKLKSVNQICADIYVFPRVVARLIINIFQFCKLHLITLGMT